jgi:hypothetical protein
MKTTIFKISVLVLLIALMGAGCDDQPNEALDPGLSIYKTRNDYFNNVHTELKDGKAIFITDLMRKVEINADGKVKYKFRVKLTNGYILGCEEGLTTAYLSYTIADYYQIQKQGLLPSMNEIQSSIIDADPFVEYYQDINRPRTFELKDTLRINEIISNGEIEKYFKKLK